MYLILNNNNNNKKGTLGRSILHVNASAAHPANIQHYGYTKDHKLAKATCSVEVWEPSAHLASFVMMPEVENVINIQITSKQDTTMMLT